MATGRTIPQIKKEVIFWIMIIIIVYFFIGYELTSIFEVFHLKWKFFLHLYLLSFVPSILSLILFLSLKNLTTLRAKERMIFIIISVFSIALGICAWALKKRTTSLLTAPADMLYVSMMMLLVGVGHVPLLFPSIFSLIVSFLIALDSKSKKSGFLVGIIVLLLLICSTNILLAFIVLFD